MYEKRVTYGQLKALVLKLLDESNPKNDLTVKIPVFADTAQREVSLYCPVRVVLPVEGDTLLPEDCRRVTSVLSMQAEASVEYRVIQTADGALLQSEVYPALIWYEKIPESITSTTEVDYELELPEKAVLAMAYYIAAQCNSMEYDQRFFQSFFAQYQGKLANLAADSTGPEFTATVSSDLPDWM